MAVTANADSAPESESEGARTGVIKSIRSWVQLLALVVLVGEAVLLVAMKLTPDNSPHVGWYPIAMIALLAVVVIGVFIDRLSERSSTERLTLALGDREVSVDTSRTFLPAKPGGRAAGEMFVDSEKGYSFPRPSSTGWKKPIKMNTGELLFRQGILKSMDDWEDLLEAPAVAPLGRMLMMAEHLYIQLGEPIEVVFTEDSTTDLIEGMIDRLRQGIEEENGKPDTDEARAEHEEGIKAVRKKLMQGQLDIEKVSVSNCIIVSSFDKALAAGSQVPPTLANVFLTHAKTSLNVVDNLVANQESILWGSKQTTMNVLLNGAKREVTTYTACRLLETGSRTLCIQATFCPQTNVPLSAWDEINAIFNAFRVLPEG